MTKSFSRKCVVSVLLLAVFFSGAFAQSDTEFWFAAPEVSSDHGDQPIFLRISTRTQTANVEISQPANPAFLPIQVNIAANSAETINLTPFKSVIENQPADQVLNYGLHIRSSAPITAYYEVNSNNNPEIFALKGNKAKGTEFYLPFQTHYDNGSYNPPARSGFDIVATEDNTQVTITPTTNIVGHSAGIPYTITLQKGQTWSGISPGTSASAFPAGTHVTSTRPICITIKDDSAISQGSRDLMGDQIVPVDVVGDEYIIMKGFIVGANERVYVLAIADNTEIYVGGSTTPSSTLNTGQQFALLLTAPTTYLRATHPVYVLHVSGFGRAGSIFVSATNELGSALLPSLNCTGSSAVYFTRSTTELFGLNVMVRNGSQHGFLLNGNPSLLQGSDFTVVPGTNNEWVAAQKSFSEQEVPVGQTSVLTTTTTSRELFHLGIIHGGSSSGCRYGYFSDYGSLNLGGNLTLCTNDSLEISAGANKDTYLWNTGDTTSSIIAKDAGLYWVTVTKEGCESTDTVTVVVDEVNISLGNDTLFCEDEDILLNLDAGSGFISYKWQNNSTGQSFTATMPGTYWVEAASFAGCTARDSIVITAASRPPAPLISSNQPVCAGDTLYLAAELQPGAVSFWNGPNGFSSAEHSHEFINAQTSLSGIYGISQTVNGCQSEVSQISLIVSSVPDPFIAGDTLVCDEGEVILSVTSGQDDVTYNWSNGAAGETISVSAGTYEVVAVNTYGCKGYDTVTVHLASPLVDIILLPADTVLLGTAQTFDAGATQLPFSPALSHLWDFGNGDFSTEQKTVYTYPDTGAYTAAYWVQNELGCESRMYQTVKVIDGVQIPNAFSPQGDNINDLFYIGNLWFYKTPQLTVFNRWGRMVYKSENYQNDWDGGDLPAGTYFYILVLPDVQKEFKGTLFLSKGD